MRANEHPSGTHQRYARLHTLAQAASTRHPHGVSGSAQAIAVAHAGILAGDRLNLGPAKLQGLVAGHVEGVMAASASGIVMRAPSVLAAQGQALAMAAGRIRAGAMGSAEVGAVRVAGGAAISGEAIARAGIQGAVIATPTSFAAHGKAEAEALARAQAAAAGSASIGELLFADGGVAAEMVSGGEARAEGLVHLGVDRFGLPHFGIGAEAEGATGAWVRTASHGRASILGLIEVGASGAAEALGGLAAGLRGLVSLKDRGITLGAGAKAAAGIGAGADATVSVGLGKLPAGILQTVGAPVLPIPGLLGTSLVRLVHTVTGTKGEDPTAGQPGIEDLPKVVVANVSNGIALIGQGATELAGQVADAGVAIAKGVGSAATGLVKAIGGLFKD